MLKTHPLQQNQPHQNSNNSNEVKDVILKGHPLPQN
jgi:hypothetical protein